MQPYRSRTVKSTPTNVQCQKCLKRDMWSACAISAPLTVLERHYSYECKATPAERPYVPRPSRTQQLKDPKLVPKLTEAVPDILQRKKGVADEVLAKREAERAKTRRLEDGDMPAKDSARNKRAASYDSISSYSTRSPSPIRALASTSPGKGRPGNFRHSISPERRPPRSPSRSADTRPPSVRTRRKRSPPARQNAGVDRGVDRGRRVEFERHAKDDRRQGRSPSRSRSCPRSPVGEPADGRGSAEAYRVRDDHRHQKRSPPPREVSSPRERSLSPFSKRLALTRAMNMGSR